MLPNQITDEQAMHILQNKKLLHASLIQRNYDVPKMAAPVCTHEFLLQVYERDVFVLKREQVRDRNVFGAPTNDELHQAVLAGLATTAGKPAKEHAYLPVNHGRSSQQNLLDHLTAKQGDREWMLRLLSTMHVRGLDCPFFKAGAVQKQAKGIQRTRVPQIDPDFFSGVQPLTVAELRQRGRGVSIPKADLLSQQIEEREKRAVAADAKTQALKDELASERDRSRFDGMSEHSNARAAGARQGAPGNVGGYAGPAPRTNGMGHTQAIPQP